MKITAKEWFNSFSCNDQYDILIRFGYTKELILNNTFELSESELKSIWIKQSNYEYVQELKHNN